MYGEIQPFGAYDIPWYRRWIPRRHISTVAAHRQIAPAPPALPTLFSSSSNDEEKKRHLWKLRFPKIQLPRVQIGVRPAQVAAAGAAVAAPVVTIPALVGIALAKTRRRQKLTRKEHEALLAYMAMQQRRATVRRRQASPGPSAGMVTSPADTSLIAPSSALDATAKTAEADTAAIDAAAADTAAMMPMETGPSPWLIGGILAAVLGGLYLVFGRKKGGGGKEGKKTGPSTATGAVSGT